MHNEDKIQFIKELVREMVNLLIDRLDEKRIKNTSDALDIISNVTSNLSANLISKTCDTVSKNMNGYITLMEGLYKTIVQNTLKHLDIIKNEYFEQDEKYAE